MSVSAPRGVMSPTVPARSVQQLAAKQPPVGGFAKALMHHGHIGTALKAGDHKKAMHHIGHMMLAIRNATKPGASATTAAAAPVDPDNASDGTDDGAMDSMPSAVPAMPSAPSAPIAPKAPPKRSFNRSLFGAMKK